MTRQLCKKCKVQNTESLTCQGCTCASEIETYLDMPTSEFRKILAKKSVLMIYYQNGHYTTTDETLNQQKLVSLEKSLRQCPAFQKLRFLKIKGFYLHIETRYFAEEDQWDLQVRLHLPMSIAEPGYSFIYPT